MAREEFPPGNPEARQFIDPVQPQAWPLPRADVPPVPESEADETEGTDYYSPAKLVLRASMSEQMPAEETAPPAPPRADADEHKRPPVDDATQTAGESGEPERRRIEIIATPTSELALNRNHPDQGAVDTLRTRLDRGLPSEDWVPVVSVQSPHSDRVYYRDSAGEPTYLARVTGPPQDTNAREPRSGENELELAEDVQAVVASDRVQQLAQSYGFASIQHAEPLAVVTDFRSGTEATIYKYQVEEAQSDTGGPGSSNGQAPESRPWRVDQFVAELDVAFRAMGIVPDGLDPSQFRVAVDDMGAEHLRMVYGEGFFKPEAGAPLEPADDWTMAALEESSYGQQEAARLTEEIWREVEAQADPATRLDMIAAAIGDCPELAPAAMSALQEMTSADGSDVSSDQLRLTKATPVIQALVDAGRFSDADAIFGTVKHIDHWQSLRIMGGMLSSGYAGENNQYLNIELTPQDVMELKMTDQHQGATLDYLRGLAHHGVNMLDSRIPAARVFQDACLDDSVTGIQKDYYSYGLAEAYAGGGHFKLADTIRRMIADPYVYAKASLAMAAGAAQYNDNRRWDQFLTEAGKQLDYIAHCDTNCGRIDCMPVRDSKEIETGMAAARAAMHARPGDIPERDALDPVMTLAMTGSPDYRDPSIQLNQARAQTELYAAEQEGFAQEVVRDDALDAISNLARTSGDPAVIAPLIRRVGEIDLMHGYTELAFDGDFEAVPRVSREIGELFDRLPGHKEGYTRDMTQVRDRSLAMMVEVVAPIAPFSAQTMVNRIQSPVEYLRAKAILARVLRGS